MYKQLFILILGLLPLTLHAQQAAALLPEITPQSEQTNRQPLIKPFSADYTTEWKLGWFSIDIDAKRQLKQVAPDRWQLLFEAKTGAAKLRETSEFTLSDRARIQPLSYQYRASGLFNEDDRTLHFLPSDKSVRDEEKKQTHQQVWQDEIQDNLTYMLQAGLDLAKGKTRFEYPVFEKNKSKPFRFEVIGEETLKTKAGKLRTIKVKQVREKKGREIYAWFAIDKNYLLVRLQDKKKGKKRYEINVTRIQM